CALALPPTPLRSSNHPLTPAAVLLLSAFFRLSRAAWPRRHIDQTRHILPLCAILIPCSCTSLAFVELNGWFFGVLHRLIEPP
ncbi:hypothetical protein EMPG_11505, partial [Blastomyces silverae]